MSNTHQALGVIYEARRQSRGPGKPAPRKVWRRRLIIGVSLLLVIAAVAIIFYVNWTMNRIGAVQARVWANVVTLAPDSSGQIKEMIASPGDVVEPGQVLATLDDGQAAAMLAVARAELNIRESLHEQAKADLDLTIARVQTQMAQARLNVDIAAGRLNSSRAEIELRRSRVPAEIRRAEAQRDIAQSILAGLSNGPPAERVEIARIQLDTERTLLELQQVELDWSQRLYERNMESLHMVETNLARVKAQTNRVKERELHLVELEAGARPEEIEAARHELVSRDAALVIARTAQMELDTLDTQLSMRQAELELAEAELVRAERLELEVKRAEERVKAAEAELQKAAADERARLHALNALQIKSTVEGTVIRTFRRTGELARAGEALIMIADDSAGKWIECYVRERDALRVRVGQTARVEVIAGSGQVVQAEVMAVGLHTQSSSNMDGGAATPARAGSELVWVKLKPTEELGANLLGMSARATIFTK